MLLLCTLPFLKLNIFDHKMKTLKKLVEFIEEAESSGYGWDEYMEFLGEIQQDTNDLLKKLNVPAKTRSLELNSEIWDFIHTQFFLQISLDPNPTLALKRAISTLEPKLSRNNKNMSAVERQSFEEFSRILDISKKLITSLNSE